jgi:hypothetical protein
MLVDQVCIVGDLFEFVSQRQLALDAAEMFEGAG